MAGKAEGIDMNKRHPSFSVNECKIQATKLLKALPVIDEEKTLLAAKRLQRLPEFQHCSLAEIKNKVKRKHALNVIAMEKGFNNWSELKQQLPFIKGGFLNHWFNTYDEAKAFLVSKGGYLLPYQKQFFICNKDYINHLGFDANDPDWNLIEYDWVHPKHDEAAKRLYRKWMKIQGENHA